MTGIKWVTCERHEKKAEKEKQQAEELTRESFCRRETGTQPDKAQTFQQTSACGRLHWKDTLPCATEETCTLNRKASLRKKKGDTH